MTTHSSLLYAWDLNVFQSESNYVMFNHLFIIRTLLMAFSSIGIGKIRQSYGWWWDLIAKALEDD